MLISIYPTTSRLLRDRKETQQSPKNGRCKSMTYSQLLNLTRYLLRRPVRPFKREWARLRLVASGLNLAPSVIIDRSRGCSIVAGKGSSVGSGSILIAQSQSKTGNHIIIGNGVAINEYNNLRAAGGDIRIGNYCQIAQFCTLVASNHAIETPKHIIEAPWDTSKHSICIEDDVWIGANCVILPGVTIGRGAVIGAGSIVTKSVPAYSVHAGNPARCLKTRTLHS